MKYLDKSFRSPANSQAFVDNWAKVFDDQPAPAEKSVKDASPKRQPARKETNPTKK